MSKTPIHYEEVRFNLRISNEDQAAWTAAAERAGFFHANGEVYLVAWIRAVCTTAAGGKPIVVETVRNFVEPRIKPKADKKTKVIGQYAKGQSNGQSKRT